MFELMTLFRIVKDLTPYTLGGRGPITRQGHPDFKSSLCVLCNKQCGKKPKTSGFFGETFFFTPERQVAGFARNLKAIGTYSLPV